MLARELLSKPDGFLIAKDNNNEYVIESFKRVFTEANVDDSVPYWALTIHKCDKGNIKR